MAALRRRRRIHWSIKVGVALGTVLATAYITLTAKKILPDDKDFEGAAIGLIAVVSMGSSVRSAVWGTVADKHADRVTEVREALIGAMFTAQQITRTDVREMNAVFLVIRRDARGQYLDPAVRAEFGAHEPSSVRWTKGKGVVGLAWEKEQAQFADIRALHGRRAGCKPEEWDNGTKAESRMGLSFDEWEKTQGKYGTIVAACTRQNGAGITGVVAMNAPLTEDWLPYESELRKLLVLTAQTVSGVLK